MVLMRGTEQGPHQTGAQSHGNIRYGASLVLCREYLHSYYSQLPHQDGIHPARHYECMLAVGSNICFPRFW